MNARPSLALAVVAGLLLTAGCTSSAEQGQAPSDDRSDVAAATEALLGTWGRTSAWEGYGYPEMSCDENPHTITVSGDSRTLTLTYPKPFDEETGKSTSVYEVLGVDGDKLQLRLLGEVKGEDAEALTRWELIQTSPDEYVWKRADWSFWQRTGPIERCETPE